MSGNPKMSLKSIIILRNSKTCTLSIQEKLLSVKKRKKKKRERQRSVRTEGRERARRDY